MKPSDEVFKEMRRTAILIWKDRDIKFGYDVEKIKKVRSIENISDNAMIFYRMFDHWSKQIMISKLSEESINYIKQNK